MKYKITHWEGNMKLANKESYHKKCLMKIVEQENSSSS